MAIDEYRHLFGDPPELVRRLHPPLNVHGVDPEHIQPAVVAAKNASNTSSRPTEPTRAP